LKVHPLCKKPWVYHRDDREELKRLPDALGDAQVFIDAMLIMERYGLSVTFNDATLEWKCSDPQGLYYAYANTPAGAVILWDEKR